MHAKTLEEGIGSPGAGVTVGWEPPCRYWDKNPGPLEEHQLLWNVELLA